MKERMHELKWRGENIKKKMTDEELLKTVEDIESKMADEMSDRELLRAVKRIKSPLFEFEFRTIGPRKCCKENVVAKQWFTTRLKELRRPSQDDNVGVEIIHA